MKPIYITPRAIYITDKDLKEWNFGGRLLSLKKHFSDFGSTLERIQIDCEDTIWIYEPKTKVEGK